MLSLALTVAQTQAVHLIKDVDGYCPACWCSPEEWAELVINCHCWHDSENRQYCQHTPTHQPGWEECLAEENAEVKRRGGIEGMRRYEQEYDDSAMVQRLIENRTMQG